MSDTPSSFKARTPDDLLGMVPYLLGFHPADSVVAVFMDAHKRVICAGRADREAPADFVADEFGKVAVRQGFDGVILVGYGPQSLRATIADVSDALAGKVRVVQSWLVSDGKQFCLEPGCTCPAAAGVAFDPRTTAAAARSAVEGFVALPSRDALLALVQPDPAAQSATESAIAGLTPCPDDESTLVQLVMDYAHSGARLPDKLVAFLATGLRSGPVRDAAWRATDDQMWQRDLWLDVTRRVPDAYVSAPAALAAWCLWLRGEDALALAAAQRALAVTPQYTMALIIITGIKSHVPARELISAWPSNPWS